MLRLYLLLLLTGCATSLGDLPAYLEPCAPGEIRVCKGSSSRLAKRYDWCNCGGLMRDR